MSTLRRSSSSFGSYADGIVLRGMPILGLYPGNVYWVDSNGGGSSKGTFASPVATLAEGTALCTSNNGDYVMMKPGHAETITGAGGITFDKAGVSYIGMGRYDARPTFLMDGGTTVTCLVTAANVGIYNCKFIAGHSDIATFSTITGKGCRFEGNYFGLNTTSENFVKIFTAGVADNDCDGLELIDNVADFRGDAGELLPFHVVKDSDDIIIAGNKIYFDGDTTLFSAIYSHSDEIHYNCEICWNQIHNLHNADALVGISFGSTGSTGFMHHNIVYALDTNGGTPFVSAATGIAMWDNKYAHAGNISAYQMPTLGTYAA